MERYKVSRYNKFFDDEDGTHLMFNGVSGAFVTINSEKYPHVREILASPNNPIWDTGEYKDLKDKLVYG